MISSIILALGLATSPVSTEASIEETPVMQQEAASRKVKIASRKVKIASRKVKIASRKVKIASRKVKIQKIRSSIMIKFIKNLFVTEIEENPIAARIEIKEVSATTWWS